MKTPLVLSAVALLGQAIGPAESVEPGLVTARDNESASLTHRVLNVGTTAFDVIDVRLLSRPARRALGTLTHGLTSPWLQPTWIWR